MSLKLRQLIATYVPVTKPHVLQIDTTTVCNLGTCIYCNPHGVGWAAKPETMTTEMIESILRDATKFRSLFEVRPFINGDPLMEPRMPAILRMCRKYLPGVRIILYSNGADSTRLGNLIDGPLDELHFTVSAASPETYLKVHGKPLFHEVLKSYHAALDRGVNLTIHFVECQQNRHEVEAWSRLFGEAKQMVSAIHVSEEQSSSVDVLVGGVDESTMIAHKSMPNMACNCWNNLAIGVHGEVMQCCDASYQYNYGFYPMVSLELGWRLRIANGLLNGGCAGCNLRSPDWRKRVRYSQIAMGID